MSADDISVTAIAMAKHSDSQKHRVHSHKQSARKSRIEQFQVNRTMTAYNRPSSKLPHVSTKATANAPTFESMVLKRYRSPEKERFAQSPSKLERQSITVCPEKRLPILYSLTNEDDQKRKSEFRRRQIYALNHFMRHLEQEQFRQFCEAYDINTMKSENTTDTIEDATTNSPT